jgi:hypothetical protein
LIAGGLAGLLLAGCANPGPPASSPFPTPTTTANVSFDVNSGLGAGSSAATALGDETLYNMVQSGGMGGARGGGAER